MDTSVCTDVSMNSQGGIRAFFNQQVHIFVEMISEPLPAETNLQIFLTHMTKSANITPTDRIVYADGGSANIILVYVIQVPDLPSMEGTLSFIASYSSVCDTESPQVSYQIPILQNMSEWQNDMVQRCTHTRVSTQMIYP